MRMYTICIPSVYLAKYENILKINEFVRNGYTREIYLLFLLYSTKLRNFATSNLKTI